jgi:TonB family protein
MAANNTSADIVQMNEARARRALADNDPTAFASLGAYLKAVRDAAGLTLAEVSERTHIKESFLDAIEQSAYGALPSRPFAIGFVRVYAAFLGLPPADMVNRFKEEAGMPNAAPIEPEKFEAVHRNEPDLDRPGMSLWAVLLISGFIVWCVFQIVTAAHERTRPLPSSPAQTAPANAVAPARPVAPAITGLPAEASADFVEAALIDRVEPIYPQRCEIGSGDLESVEVAFNVTTRGVVSGARIASATNACFEDAALYAIRRWRFEPRQVNGEARPAYDLRTRFEFARPR